MITIEVAPGMKMIIDPMLEDSRFKYCFEHIKNHGKSMPHGPYPEQLPAAPFGTRCFNAAFALAHDYPFSLKYCEGILIINHGGVVNRMIHAWCYEKGHGVVDPVLASFQHRKELIYCGFGVKLGYVEKEYIATGYYGVIDGRQDRASKGGIYHDPEEWWLEKIIL